MSILTIRNESHHLRKEILTVAQAELLAGLTDGTIDEQRQLETLKNELGVRLYAEALYVLLHVEVVGDEAAYRLFRNIVHHAIAMREKLGRNVGIQVAALDYAASSGHVLKSPATVVEAAQLRRIADIAEVTVEERLNDRHTLILDLQKEIERTRRYGFPFALLFIDLDNLREVNDAFGRDAGDAAILQLARLLKEQTRAADTLYRTGGNAFTLLLSGADVSAARMAAEKLLYAVREMRIPLPAGADRTFSVTVSIGVASFNDQTVQTVDGVLTTAEALLASAKKAGKNRIKILQQEGGENRFVDALERAESAGKKRFVIRGLSISPGIAMGRVFVHRDILLDELQQYEIAEGAVEAELLRLQKAVQYVTHDIARLESRVLQNLGKEYADIFAVHRAILSDASVIGEMESKLRSERVNAEHVVKNVFRRFENKFITSDNAVTRERYLDIADLSRRLLRHLRGLDRNIFGRLPRNRVIVAKRLLPSESVHLRKGKVRAIVTEKGSRTSHTAIIARGLGLPYVSELDASIDRIHDGDYVLVNADRGELIVNPTRQERIALHSVVELQTQAATEMLSRQRHFALRKEGRPLRVMANANSKAGVHEAVQCGADGIGLFRTEQIYLQSPIFPSQEQLVRIFHELFAELPDKPLIVRLLDIGGDKKLPYFEMRDELYSFMGLRGVRVLLRYPRILETQLMALLKLSARHPGLRVLVPVVTLAEEMSEVRRYLAQCMARLRKANVPFNERIPVGSMIEVPAAVIRIEEILEKSDFVSIGTNDLIQYTMASARENAVLARYYEAGTDIVMGYIQSTVQKAKEKGIECDLCGEVAADISYTERLLALGLENFSVAPSSIPLLKEKIHALLERVPAKKP